VTPGAGLDISAGLAVVLFMEVGAHLGDEGQRVGQDAYGGEFSACLSEVVGGRAGLPLVPRSPVERPALDQKLW
jgi:hypothetical protein